MAKKIVIVSENKIVPYVSSRLRRKGSYASGSFQEAIAMILVVAQFCGIMPVVGIKSKSASDLHFKWFAWRTFQFMISSALLTGYVSLSILDIFSGGLTLVRVVPVVVQLSAAVGILMFCTLAKKWPHIMSSWEAIEAKLPEYRSLKEKSRLEFRIKLFVIIFLISVAAEDILNTTSDVYYVKNCESDKDLLQGFFRKQLSHIFMVTDYALWKGLLGKSIRMLTAFVRNYLSMFIVIISIGLSSRFKQLNVELKRIKGQAMSEDYWEFRRLQYRSLAELCELVDEAVSPIIIIALGNNLFCICIQLLRSLQPKTSFMAAIYFWSSLIFLLFRTISVFLFAAAIHDESKKPIHILRAIPRNVWCIEVERFVEQVVNGRISLSGMRFFFLTRKVLLSAIGTIITYEVVLMQFQENKNELLCPK